jgi:class 3 adenylate cyclase/tetratricopeptide (TPR) repeat protein
MAESDRGHHGLRAAHRRHLTILFSDLSEFTALTGSVEPEYCLDVVDHLKQCSKRVVSKYGGIVVDFRGDSVMAMFGFPQPSEHDGRRATEAALELREAIRHLPASGVPAALPPLGLHTGVHSGLVLLIENDPSPGQYAVIGEAPNVAARLSDLAADDEILVSATTLGGESHFFDIRERGDVSLHGKIKPVAVIQVLGHSPASTRYEARTQRGLSPFVGRTRELNALDRYLREAMTGGACEVAVIASAGVGKTRLVEQFLQGSAHLPIQVCRGYCENYRGAEPLQPFLQMLRQLAKQDPGETSARSDYAVDGTRHQGVRGATASPELQRVLSIGLLSSMPAASRSSDDAASALCELFAAMAGRRSLILFIDDWQWADDATNAVMARMREMELRSVLLLTASREPLPDAGRRSAARVLDLAPFDRDEAAEAILKLRPGTDPLEATRIQQLSGGNPLFIEELCHRTVHVGADLEIDRGDSLPAWLSTLIESRVGRLPPQQVELVRVAAVIGAVVPAWLLEQVTGYSDDDPILHELADKDLIYPGEVEGTLRFKHGITRDVIYASVGLRERETLHRRIASLLERRAAEDGYEALLEPLSYHFRAGAEPERAAHYAELAGDKALAAAAPDRARSQYAAALTALDLLQPSDGIYRRWSRIVHRLGLACVFDPTRDQLRIFGRAAEIARQRGDLSGMARAEYWLGFIYYALGDPGDAIHHYELARAHCFRALESAGSAGDQEQALEMEALGVQLLAAIGQARAAAGEHDLALGLLDEALAVKRRHRRSARPAVGSAYALACKGAVLGDLGRFAEAYECFDEALEAIRAGHSAVESSVVGWRSAVYLWHGRWQEAQESATRAQSLAQRVGSLYVLAMGQSVAAYATWMSERTPSSVDVIARATSWLEARDKRLSISMSYGWLADVTAAMADAGKVRVYAARAIHRARVRDTIGEAMSYRALASLPWRGRGRRPEEYLTLAMRSALARRSPREQAVTLLHQAQHAARSGQRPEAYHLLERARSQFVSMEMRWHDAAAQQCLTELDAAHSPP